MSQVHQQENSVVDSEEDLPQSHLPPNPTGGRKPAKLGARKAAVAAEPAEPAENDVLPAASTGRRIVPVHQSRIKDRPEKVGEKDSSLKIKIELDLEVEVELYARVKGDVTIGLM
ncbi:hypothetical protein N7491_006246 [Penicillium cf. griseofulvum]|uniref:Uncharacterized protein n=1 Tax=Penicillium cf. griseofulvum TaxID=2972120 RepID=A0A9W9IXL4_9EURO|nr:hypothetical protein N7472_010724 [Penicillium cf. griseofulvum]KAJ5429230.1 hypothetical protein N7491_006246 [Penicillium cf. griseofulvum]KAJ5436977.1 hypothetical protein N7445_007862 [Penicillium cf. griseofulvum]